MGSGPGAGLPAAHPEMSSLSVTLLGAEGAEETVMAAVTEVYGGPEGPPIGWSEVQTCNGMLG
jgi:hypothetical protein